VWLLPTLRVTAPQKNQRALPPGKALTQARSPLQSLEEGTLLFLLATSYPTAVRGIKSPHCLTRKVLETVAPTEAMVE